MFHTLDQWLFDHVFQPIANRLTHFAENPATLATFMFIGGLVFASLNGIFAIVLGSIFNVLCAGFVVFGMFQRLKTCQWLIERNNVVAVHSVRDAPDAIVTRIGGAFLTLFSLILLCLSPNPLLLSVAGISITWFCGNYLMVCWSHWMQQPDDHTPTDAEFFGDHPNDHDGMVG